MLEFESGHSVTLRLAGRQPYHHHNLTLSRSRANARLRVEIESFSVGSPDPTRIEIGPLTKLGVALKQRYGLDANALVQSLEYAHCSARLIAEADDDMTEAALNPESLETTEQEST